MAESRNGNQAIREALAESRRLFYSCGLFSVFEDLAKTLGVAGSAPEAPGLAAEPALTPGMPAEVHIRTGDRSVISFLAKPITDFFQRSMREE